MDELMKKLEKLTEELLDNVKDDKKDDRKDLIKRIEEAKKELDEFKEDKSREEFILMTKERSIIYGSKLSIMGLTSCLCNRLVEDDDLPLEFLTDAVIRGLACDDSDPAKINSKKIKKILKKIQEIVEDDD